MRPVWALFASTFISMPKHQPHSALHADTNMFQVRGWPSPPRIPRRPVVPRLQSTVTVSCSILATTDFVAGPRKSSRNRESCIKPGLIHSLITMSIPKIFLQENPTPQLQQTTCRFHRQLTPIVRRTRPNKFPKNALTAKWLH